MTLGDAPSLIMWRAHLHSSRRAEQTMVMPAEIHRWTVEEVRKMQDESRPWPRYELIGGELLVTPSPGWVHQYGVSEILILVGTYVRREKVGRACPSPADLELHVGTVAQPDVFVIPQALRPSTAPNHTVEMGWTWVKSLLVAIEVISPSSIRSDRIAKRDYYLSAGVPEYWVIDCDARTVERWTQHGAAPETLRESLVWMPTGAKVPFMLNLPEFFGQVWEG
jgi:Uma2 family endonuclease